MRPIRVHVLALAGLALGSFASVAHAAPPPSPWKPAPVVRGAAAAAEDDPDLPAFMQGIVDKGAYLGARQQQYALMRGLPYPGGADARVAAIGQMQQVQQALGAFSSGPQWTAIGPMPIPNGQTVSSEVPVSGRVTAIAVHPTNSNTVYVGTAQGGVYRSLNGGATWTAIFDQAQTLAIGALALAPSDPTILYVGTGETSGSCDSYFGVGLYRVDHADTTPILVGPFNPPVTTGIAGTTAFTGLSIGRILVHPTDPATVFVATTVGIGGQGCNLLASSIPARSLQGLYRTTNGTAASPAFQKLKVTPGGSVSPDTSGDRPITDMVFAPGNPAAITCWAEGNAAVNDAGIWQTTNALDAVPVFTQRLVSPDYSSRGALAVTTTHGVTTMMLATDETPAGTSCTVGNSRGELRRSSDGGVTWSGKITAAGGFCGGQCWYDLVVAMSPTDSGVVYLGGSATGTCSADYEVSTNGGVSFTVDDGYLHADTHAIVPAPGNPLVVYLGNDGGIFRSADGGLTWASLNNTGFSATQFQSIAVHPTDPLFLIGGTQDNGTEWRNTQGLWSRADWGDGGWTLIDPSSASTTSLTMYHTYYNSTHSFLGFARVSSTACATEGQWVWRGYGSTNAATGCEGAALAANNGISYFDSAVLFYAPMALGPGTPATLYFGSDRLYRSVDRGDNMAAVSQQFSSGVAVSAIGIAPGNDAIRIAGLQNGLVFATGSGANPMTLVSTSSMPARYVSRAVIVPSNTNTAYLSYSGFGLAGGAHVWKTTDLSDPAPVWTASGSGIPDVPVNALAVDPNNPSSVWAGTDIGVYHSTDAGASWLPANTGLPVVAVFDMAIQPVRRLLVVATHGRGMWEYPLDSPTGDVAGTRLLGSEVVGGHVHLQWSVAGAQGSVQLYRRFVPGDWNPIATLQVAGDGTVSYDDADVLAGQTYEYAIGGSTSSLSGQVWVDVTEHPLLAVRSVRPNPSRGGMTIGYSLASSAPATLSLVDVNGRRVYASDVTAAGAGVHELRLADPRLAPGLYWVRLEQGGRSHATRVTILR